jgi:hypothetical protein
MYARCCYLEEPRQSCMSKRGVACTPLDTSTKLSCLKALQDKLQTQHLFCLLTLLPADVVLCCTAVAHRRVQVVTAKGVTQRVNREARAAHQGGRSVAGQTLQGKGQRAWRGLHHRHRLAGGGFALYVRISIVS